MSKSENTLNGVQFTHPLDEAILSVINDSIRTPQGFLANGSTVEESRSVAKYMLTLQTKTNMMAVGSMSWVTDGLPFAKAAAMEVAEAMDHRTWEWWASGTAKGKSPNPLEVAERTAIEYADATLFLLSAIMVESFRVAVEDTSWVERVAESMDEDGLSVMLVGLALDYVGDALRSASNNIKNLRVSLFGDEEHAPELNAESYRAPLDRLEQIALHHCTMANLAAYSDVRAIRFGDTIRNLGSRATTMQHLKDALTSVVTLHFLLGGNLLSGFTAKSALFHFRMRNGYKTGEYKKIWDGTEDNDFLDHANIAAQAMVMQDVPKGETLPASVAYPKVFDTLLEQVLPKLYKDHAK